MKKCLVGDCSKIYYAKGYCRNHYRVIVNKESKKYWQKVLSNSGLHENRKKSYKEWEQRVKFTEDFKKRRKISATKTYLKHREKRISYVKKWKKNLSPDRAREYYRKDNFTRQFGSWRLRELVIKRDGEKCIKCGITREEHKKRWNQDLHVDHRDNYGRNVVKDEKNNNLSNLETLCIRCHRSKSSKEQWNARRQKLLIYGKDFTEELKEKIREQSGRLCKDCGKIEKQNRRRLDVHHINGNKHDNREENLIPLCTVCHYKRELLLKQQNT